MKHRIKTFNPFWVLEYPKNTHLIDQGSSLSLFGQKLWTKQIHPKTLGGRKHNGRLGNNTEYWVFWSNKEEGNQFIK